VAISISPRGTGTMNYRAAILSIIILLFSVASHAQPDFRRLSDARRISDMNSGSLTITVRDGRGSPAVDARVEVRDQQLGQVVKSGYTNSAGVVELSDLTYGNYDVTITKGLTQITERTDVRSMGSAVYVTLALEGANADVGGKSTVSVAQYKIPGKARKELEKAEKAISERKLEKAEEHIGKALEIHPKYSDALTLRAILKMDRDEVDAATADLDKALEFDSANARAYLVYGANLNKQSKFDQAIQTLERGISLDPNAWQGYFEMGKAQIGKANYKQSLKYLEKAQVLVNFEYPPIHLVKGHALLAMKEYEAAMGELELFLNKSPQDPRSDSARKTLEQVRAFVQR
jgi:hypothetical protein